MKKNQIILICVSVIVLTLGYYFVSKFVQSKQDKELDALAKKSYDAFIRPHSPRLGPENPKVYLVEFLDPECESCRRFYPLVKDILKDFPGKIQLVVRYTPFHRNSKYAIAILEAARKQNLFWPVLETLFKYQPVWGDHHNPAPEKIWDFLPQVDGIDIAKIKSDMNDPAIANIIQQDIADAQLLGVRATPTFFINGKKLQQFGITYLREAIINDLN